MWARALWNPSGGCAAIVVALLTGCMSAQGSEWSGYAAVEGRHFFEDAADPRQHGDNLSFSFEPEYVHEWQDGRQVLTFVPFARLDGHDSARTHFDIRELTWEKAAQTWELRLGIRKLFWGVTESRHLVDIINQTDLVEDPDGEDKLGQPMINLALIREWGTMDLYLMPWFRERTFPGVEGRLRPALPVAVDEARYESGARDHHLDWAVRWSRSAGVWDMGLSYFDGTARAPRLLPEQVGGEVRLVPYYDQLQQVGLDIQATLDAWLWKLEAVSRHDSAGRSSAFTGGFEYTFYGVVGDGDLGVLMEYSFDDRGDAFAVMDNDVFVGARFTLNDAQSSELLAGVIMDMGGDGRLVNIEASRRLGDAWKLSLEARFFVAIPDAKPLTGLRHDDYLQIELARYF